MTDKRFDHPARVVIVGAGHGGGTAAALLRRSGYTGEVVVVGREPWLPYHRPPLSKGSAEHGGVPELIYPDDFYGEQSIDIRTSTEVEKLDVESRRILTTAGPITYDALILATGSRARHLPLPGSHLQGILTLRTYEDAAELTGRLRPGSRLVVVGGGYIGLEAAAVAVARGVQATVVEREDRVLSRGASEHLSAWLEEYHVVRGTRLVMGAQVAGFADDGGGVVTSVELRDGRALPCDAVLVGAGGVPEVGLAVDAGLEIDDGVVVDSSSRTSAPDVYAIGDMTSRSVVPGAPLARLESIHNAVEQAGQAVADILGCAGDIDTPWFWSDQFDLKIQIAGLVQLSSRTVERAVADGMSRAWFHLAPDGTLVAVEAVNDGQAFIAGKKWIGEARRPDPEVLTDTTARLREAIAK